MSEGKAKTTLDKKSVKAIADQVQNQLRPGNGDLRSARTKPDYSSEGHGGKKLFFWGAASGVALALAAPLLGKQARPAVRGVIKGGILAGRYVQKVSSSLKEDVQDLAAEASADLETEGQNPARNGNGDMR